MTQPALRLRVSAAAADFVRGQSTRQSAEMALMVYGVVSGTPPNLARREVDERGVEELADLGRNLMRTLPPKIRVKWAVGVKELDRLPKEDIHVIDGIACYLPDELIELIGERAIVLDQGRLRLDPDLESFETDRPVL